VKRRHLKSVARLGKQKTGIPLIAELAKVAIGTVDRALHGRKGVSETTRKRILEIANHVGYTPNLAARMLSVGHANLKIGVCIPRATRVFYDQVRDGILDECRRFESSGVEVDYRPIAKLGLEECERLREMLETDVSAVIITPGNPDCLRSTIDEAEKKNIRVICVASDAPGSLRSSVVCVDPNLGGRLAAELMGRFVGPGAKTAVVTGMLHTEDHRKKTEGFCTMFAQYCEGGQVVDVIEGHADEDETFEKCLKMLATCPDIAGLYVNIVTCLPVCYALKACGLAGKVRLITTDLFEEMVPFVEKQTIHASIYQRPYVQGQTAARMIVEHALRGHPIPTTHYLGPALVMRSNLYLFRETRHLKPPPTPQHDIEDSPASLSQ
jgi:LacI family transcriptional regulator